jgi:sulfur carrier protein ThiS
MKSLNEMFDEVILNNELSGNLDAAYRFSHAEGGTSGWSFGRSQFDVKNNSTARALLSKLGFTASQVLAIQDETADPRQWNDRLKAGAAIIDAADTDQLSYCLGIALNFATAHGIPVENPSGILGLADYCNQYGTPGAESAAYYTTLGHPVTAADVLNFKLNHTAYGKANPADCRRRYAGVMKAITDGGTNG